MKLDTFHDNTVVPLHRDDEVPVDQAWTMVRPKPRPEDNRTPWEIERDVNECRAHGLQEWAEYRAQGRPGRALYAIARSVERQARIAELGDPPRIMPDSLQTDVGWWARP